MATTDLTLVVKTVPLSDLLKGLSREYERAQAEQDKAFMAKDSLAEAIASGRCDGLRTAVRVVAGLENDAAAAALLDALDGGE